MNTPNHERLLRHLQGMLPPEEEARLQRDLTQSPDLRAELHAVQAMQDLLQTTVRASSERALKPFFADRLMRRLAPDPQGLGSPDEEVFGVLWRLFRPVAVAALLIILGLATYNITFSDAYDVQPTTTEAVLGLPPVTIATAYDFDLSTTPSRNP